MAGPDGRSWTGTLLIAVGVVVVVGSLAAGVGVVGGVGDTEYAHTVLPVDEHHCSGPGTADRYRHGALSPTGRDVIDRAIADPGTAVVTDEPVPAFAYETRLTPVGPQYVRADGRCWELAARQRGVGDLAPTVQGAVLAVVGLAAVLGTLTAAVGTVKLE